MPAGTTTCARSGVGTDPSRRVDASAAALQPDEAALRGLDGSRAAENGPARQVRGAGSAHRQFVRHRRLLRGAYQPE
jgi:hypothetical protein